MPATRTRIIATLALTALALLSIGLALRGAPADAVVGGRTAAAADNPSMAGLVRRGQRSVDSLFCGGSVISPTAVVTAAHCTEGLRAAQIDVVVGGTRLSQPGIQRAQVSRIINHPGYDDVRTVHDVAVLILATPLSVPAIALAGPEDEALGLPGSVLRLTGWGEQRYNDPDSAPDDLRYADIPVVADRVCERLFDVYDAKLQLCGQAPRNRPDSCQGDSGGPLVGGPAESPRLVGIVSYSADQCGSPGYAGVYVRVSAERDWIAAAAGLSGPAAIVPTTPKPAVGRSVRTRLSQIGCDDESCSVGVRVSGSGRGKIAAVIVRVRRPEQRGFSATSRYVQARKVAPGRYRARTLLPYGVVRLTAVAVDASGGQLGPAARETIEVYDG
jgi:secreted trypsin-like serine protease